MGLSKISKDIKADVEKYSSEIQSGKQVGAKHKAARLSKAEKRESRHKQMRQGINDMIHE